MKITIADLLEPLARAGEVVVFTGAGLSADSGIPTFRDGSTGLWANIDPEEVASIEGFENNPDKVWAWHESMRSLFAEVQPNTGHEGIAALEALLPNARVTVITQNIDGLHQAAGSITRLGNTWQRIAYSLPPSLRIRRALAGWSCGAAAMSVLRRTGATGCRLVR